MRLYFPNLTRPKRAAKIVASELDISLASAQRAIARACGFRDWHGLEVEACAGPPFVLDHELARDEFVVRMARLSIALAGFLSIADGDAQHALTRSRLTGDRDPALDEQLAIRIECWRSSTLLLQGPQQPGAVGILKAPGRTGEIVMLRRFGRPCEVITHYSIALVSDTELGIPETALAPFVPMRLYLPYGYWTEKDGARVVFSRDYKPLWRLRRGKRPIRLKPWEWITWTAQEHLWDDAHTPWNDPDVRAFAEQHLVANRISTLPMLVDALPVLLNGQTVGTAFGDAADILRASRNRIGL